MSVCRVALALSILLSGASAAISQPSGPPATAGKPLSLLPDSLHGDGPPATRSEPPTLPPTLPTTRSPRRPLLDPAEQERAAAELRALADRNAAKVGGGSPGFASRLRRLGDTHGDDALKQIGDE